MIISSFFVEDGDVEKAKSMLREMESRGCTPNSVMYNVILQSLLRKDEVLKATPFLEEMDRRKFVADPVTFSMLIDQLRGPSEDYLLKLMMNVFPK